LVDNVEIVTLNEKGQVTIPLRIRKSKGLKKGMKVALLEIGERVELVAMPEDLIKGLTGLGRKLPSVEEIEAEADVE
jgi:AbrB family looped-hinge helix DNA binding protein